MDHIPSPSRLLASNRLGLIGMEERARLAGARFSLRSRPRGGLVIVVEAPNDTVAGATRPQVSHRSAATPARPEVSQVDRDRE